MQMVTVAMAIRTSTQYRGRADLMGSATFIRPTPAMELKTRATEIPATMAPNVKKAERKRPAAETGNPLIASWTAETSRPEGSINKIPPATTMEGLNGTLAMKNSRANTVMMKELMAVTKKSGTRHLPNTRATCPASKMVRAATKAPRTDPPMTPTTAAPKIASAMATIQRGKGLGFLVMTSRRLDASSRVTPPPAISVTSSWTSTSPA